MRLDHILEVANTDQAGLILNARSHRCDGPLVIAGSLADGLGTALSDVDIAAFGTAWHGRCSHSVMTVERHHWGSLVVDLLRVDESAFRKTCAPIREHLLRAPREPIPRVQYEVLVLLHALQAGQPITDAGVLDELKDAVGSDLYPMLTVLRALSGFLTHNRDSDQLRELGLERAARASARYALEAVVDAALAAVSEVNPNPKWRVLLMERAARRADGGWLPWNSMAEALCPVGVALDATELIELSHRVVTTLMDQLPLDMYWEGAAVRAALSAANGEGLP